MPNSVSEDPGVTMKEGINSGSGCKGVLWRPVISVCVIYTLCQGPMKSDTPGLHMNEAVSPGAGPVGDVMPAVCVHE